MGRGGARVPRREPNAKFLTHLFGPISPRTQSDSGHRQALHRGIEQRHIRHSGGGKDKGGNDRDGAHLAGAAKLSRLRKIPARACSRGLFRLESCLQEGGQLTSASLGRGGAMARCLLHYWVALAAALCTVAGDDALPARIGLRTLALLADADMQLAFSDFFGALEGMAT